MPKRLRRRAEALRRAAAQERAETDPPEDPELVRMMLELADELEAQAARDEAAAGATPPKRACG
jgi:hypothetical protein